MSYFNADIKAYNDYYPFGMLLPGRHANTADYRYGFQGQEMDDEVKGEGNSLNYTFRMHDPRVGRFFSVDPLSPQYPHLTPFQFSSNSPIALVEIEGLEGAYNPSARDLGIAPDQIWNGAVDGYGNWGAIVGEYFISDEVEGRAIYNIIMLTRNPRYRDVVIPHEVSFEYLGRSFKIRKRNREWVIEPEDGLLSDVFDITVSVLDMSALSGSKGSGVFMAVKTGSITTKSVSSIIKGLKISARSKEILETFKDLGGSGSSFREIEAQGMAIFEETFQTTVRAIDNLDNKAGDFIVTSGKYQGKSVDLVSAVDHPKFDTERFIKSIDDHFDKDGVDLINIDIRHLDDNAKDLVKNHINNLSTKNQVRTIITE